MSGAHDRGLAGPDAPDDPPLRPVDGDCHVDAGDEDSRDVSDVLDGHDRPGGAVDAVDGRRLEGDLELGWRPPQAVEEGAVNWVPASPAVVTVG